MPLLALAPLAGRWLIQMAELNHVRQGNGAPARGDAFAFFTLELRWKDGAGPTDNEHAWFRLRNG